MIIEHETILCISKVGWLRMKSITLKSFSCYRSALKVFSYACKINEDCFPLPPICSPYYIFVNIYILMKIVEFPVFLYRTKFLH